MAFKFAGITVRDGYLVPCEFSALGGVEYIREDLKEERLGENGLASEFVTLKKVDNIELHKESKAIIGRAHYVMERTCTNTPVGYFADEEQLRNCKAELAEVQEAARVFNDIARRMNCFRRVRIAVFPVKLRWDKNDEETARRLAATVRERLYALKQTLAAGDRAAFETQFDKARNLNRLAVGIQADAIMMALEAARLNKGVLSDMIREGWDPKDAAKKLDLKQIDITIDLFREPDKDEMFGAAN